MRKFTITALTILCSFACKKKDTTDCSATACPLGLIALPSVFFNFTDTTVHRDPFFENPRIYPFNDLVVFKKKNATDTVHVRYAVDSLNAPKKFIVLNISTDTVLYAQVRNLKVDTIQLATRSVMSNCCLVGYLFTYVKLNGKIICNDCVSPGVIEIKK